MMLNQQKKVQLAIRPLEEFLAEIQKALHIAEAEVSIAFVADRQIAKWNLSYRKKKGPTDVLSFPAQSLRRIERHRRFQSPRAAKAGRAVGFLGDIAIAPETARRYAKKNNRSVDTELRVLMLHGVLHLMGYDHESDQGQMNRIEQKLRRRLGIA
jgi:probable rRNA maturation factor